MKSEHKKILIFVIVVIVVALPINMVFKVLSSLSFIAILIAVVVVYFYWPKIKKSFM